MKLYRFGVRRFWQEIENLIQSVEQRSPSQQPHGLTMRCVSYELRINEHGESMNIFVAFSVRGYPRIDRGGRARRRSREEPMSQRNRSADRSDFAVDASRTSRAHAHAQRPPTHTVYICFSFFFFVSLNEACDSLTIVRSASVSS